MARTVEFTPETAVEFVSSVGESASVEEVHLRDLSFVLDVEVEEGEVRSCRLDVAELVKAMTLYAAMEKQRYDWR
ncbi:hypothetical protein [Salinigranum salinum]|uniref:hypothetical protein n=1 Tax=Salinigranum salinum TaxID=1364937 RepID=UPI0012606559|nr:hypothetical protein [Salinigranum salinum]